MRKARPIFLVGFSRGGTNLFLNLLRSHPGVCSPRGETQEVFRGKRGEPARVRLAKRLRYWPVRLREGRDVFDATDWSARPPFRPATQRRIDAVLHAEKLRARGPAQNRYRAEGLRYTRREIAAARLLCKNLDGLILLSAEFARMYPDATFVALVRNGLAICEGHARRGADAEEVARRYDLGCRHISRDAERLPGYHVFRYEDLVASPHETLERLYAVADLRLDQVPRLRFETKAVLDADGAHRSAGSGTGKRLLWIGRDELSLHLRRDANRNQLARLDPGQRERIEKLCGWSLRRFGYR